MGEMNDTSAKYCGWPDRGPWTAYREWLLFIGALLMTGIVQVVVRPFYERFGDEIEPSEPWLLPAASDKAAR